MHYCAALFRHMGEFSSYVRDLAIFVSLDDKHRVQIGKLNYLVSTAECGRHMLVGPNETFEVGDHDFTKFQSFPVSYL